MTEWTDVERAAIRPSRGGRGLLAVACGLALAVGACSSSSDDEIFTGADCSLLAGDLVITEIMANPSGADESGEWFEIYNNTPDELNLRGVELVSSKEDKTSPKFHKIADDLMLPSGGYLVLGGVLDDVKPAHVDYGFARDLGGLGNTAGRVALQCGANIVDEVLYTDPSDGASRSFDGAQGPDPVVNDDLSNWCDATVDYDADNQGSPGEANQACIGASQTTCSEGVGRRDLIVPAAGDLVINEIHPNPGAGVVEGSGEWFEILVTRDFDLNGLQIGKGTDVELELLSETCLGATAGDYLVFAGSGDTAANGGLTRVYGLFEFGLSNSSGTLFLAHGGETLDSFTYSRSTDAASTQLDPRQANPTDNDDETNWCTSTVPYGDGSNNGTPGGANAECALPIPSGMCDDGGVIRPIAKPVAGQIVITEVMPDPAAVGDPDGEWIEILATADFDLNGLQTGKDDTVASTIELPECVRISAGSYAVLARNTDPAVFGGLPPTNLNLGLSLNNSAGNVFVAIDDQVLDTVTWANSTSGASLSLDPDALDTVLNDDPSNWCDGTQAYGDGDLGTPGAANPQCGGSTGGMCDEGGTLRAIVKPTMGQLVISEVMPDPAAVGDPDGEWIEILAIADFDLNGLQTGKDDTVASTIELPECVRISAGSYAVLARDTDTAANGGLPATNLELGLSLNNSAGNVFVGIDDQVLDAVAWANSTSGASLSLDPDALDTVSNDDPGNWCDGAGAYGDGDLGTPGAANPQCGGSTGGMCDEGGTLRAIVEPAVGDLVINEVMPSPAGTDTDEEWFEVLVGASVDLNGVIVGRSDSPQESIVGEGSATCISASSGDVLLFARKADTLVNGGLPAVDVVYGTVSLLGGAGTLELRLGATVLDAVTWPGANGAASRSLDPASADTVSNDTETNWCDGVGSYGSGGLGTPGDPNPVCGGMTAGMCNDGGTMRAIVKPTVGQLVVNEVMPSPAGTDTDEEWFEVLALANVDLAGLIIGRPSSPQSFTVPSTDCLPVTNGSLLLFAREGMAATNGGLPAVDIVYGSVSLVSAGDLSLSSDTELIDAVAWDAHTGATSVSLHPAAATSVLNDTTSNWCDGSGSYGAGGEGTPGDPNAACF